MFLDSFAATVLISIFIVLLIVIMFSLVIRSKLSLVLIYIYCLFHIINSIVGVIALPFTITEISTLIQINQSYVLWAFVLKYLVVIVLAIVMMVYIKEKSRYLK